MEAAPVLVAVPAHDDGVSQPPPKDTGSRIGSQPPPKGTSNGVSQPPPKDTGSRVGSQTPPKGTSDGVSQPPPGLRKYSSQRPPTGTSDGVSQKRRVGDSSRPAGDSPRHLRDSSLAYVKAEFSKPDLCEAADYEADLCEAGFPASNADKIIVYIAPDDDYRF